MTRRQSKQATSYSYDGDRKERTWKVGLGRVPLRPRRPVSSGLPAALRGNCSWINGPRADAAQREQGEQVVSWNALDAVP